MIAKLIPYILIYSFIAFQVFNLMYCYKASLPYELIHPISQLLLPLTPQFVLIKLIQSNSLTWVTSFIKKRNNWFIALYMQEQHSLLPLLQNWSCQFTNTILQCYTLHHWHQGCIIQPLLPPHQARCFLQPFPLQIWEFKEHENYWSK